MYAQTDFGKAATKFNGEVFQQMWALYIHTQKDEVGPSLLCITNIKTKQIEDLHLTSETIKLL